MVANTISANEIARVTPSVLSAGSAGNSMAGLMLTTNARVPVGTVPSFPTASAVSAYFGPTSAEYAAALVYFSGFTLSNIQPDTLLFARYAQAPAGAYMRGGQVGAGTLAAIQQANGTLTISIDGTPVTSGTINLSAATSFSNAAQIINTALGVAGTPAASCTGSISGTTLSVSGMASGSLAVGMEVTGSGVLNGTYITAQLSGIPGGAGTYQLNQTNTVSSETLTASIPAVAYDSVSGAFVVSSSTTGPLSSMGFATGTGTAASVLQLTQATGAVLSQGAAAATPATAMQAITQTTTNFATFMLLFDPDNGAGNTQKLAFATWNSTQEDAFLFVAWDQDITATQGNATGHLGALLKAASIGGTCLSYAPNNGALAAAFVCGAVAAIDFTQRQGRTNLAFKSGQGLVADVTNQTVCDNLKANGYNFYGAFSTVAASQLFFFDGQISGAFGFIDSYVNQIWLNSQFQAALVTFLTNTKSAPYNAAGYAGVRAALMDPIMAGANFGAFQAGVQLSTAQAQEVNTAAGLTVSDTLQNIGWYLLIQPAAPTTRAVRGSPPMTFWYMDGGSIQALNLASVEVQ